MRKKDRMITDTRLIREILENNNVCRVALKDKHGLYIVPLNYGFELINNNLFLYFHGAKEGRKADTFKKGNIEVAFEIDETTKIEGDGDIACTYTCYYKSIIGNGIASVVEGEADKKRALNLIMFNITKKHNFKYNDQSLSNVLVMKIQVSSFTAKQH